MGGLNSDFSKRLKMLYLGDILKKNCSPTQAHPDCSTMMSAILSVRRSLFMNRGCNEGALFRVRFIVNFTTNTRPEVRFRSRFCILGQLLSAMAIGRMTDQLGFYPVEHSLYGACK
jgi:hypothetical protein